MSWLESKHCDNRTPVDFGHQTSAALNSSLRGLHKIEKNSKHTKFTSQLKSGPTVQRLDKFWKHQSVKFDFTADLTGTGNRSEEVIK